MQTVNNFLMSFGHCDIEVYSLTFEHIPHILQADLYSGALFITQSVQITPNKDANIYIAAVILVLIAALFTIAGMCQSQFILIFCSQASTNNDSLS